MAADTTTIYTNYFSAQPLVLKKTREFFHKIHRDAQLTHVPSISTVCESWSSSYNNKHKKIPVGREVNAPTVQDQISLSQQIVFLVHTTRQSHTTPCRSLPSVLEPVYNTCGWFSASLDHFPKFKYLVYLHHSLEQGLHQTDSQGILPSGHHVQDWLMDQRQDDQVRQKCSWPSVGLAIGSKASRSGDAPM